MSMTEEDLLMGLMSGINATASMKLEAPEALRNKWLEKRRGFFTASEFYKLMTVMGKADTLPTGAITYVHKKVAESLTRFDADDFVTKAMQWGIDNELGAIDAYTAKTGNAVLHTGDSQRFIKYTHYLALVDQVGGTPDGIVCDSSGRKIGGIEIKCPESETHLTNLLNIKTASDLADRYPNYYWQCQGLMMISGLDNWDFVSFDHRFNDADKQLLIVPIARNDSAILKLTNRLLLAVEMKIAILENLTNSG